MTTGIPRAMIVAWTSGAKQMVTISPDEFVELEKAKPILSFGVAFEQRFDLLLENFAELERCILNAALEYSIFSGSVADRLSDVRHLANRRLSNFLSSARLYLDQNSHDLSAQFGNNSAERASFQKATHEEYDSSLAYRCIEALRNHAQHRALPVHGIQFSVSQDDVQPDGEYTKFSAAMSLSIEVLSSEGGFKSSVLKELIDLKLDDGRADLLPWVRQYVGSLGRVHSATRDSIEASVGRSDAIVDALLRKTEVVIGEPTERAEAVFKPTAKDTRSAFLSRRNIELRKSYEERSKYTSSIDRHYVSSRPAG